MFKVFELKYKDFEHKFRDAEHKFKDFEHNFSSGFGDYGECLMRENPYILCVKVCNLSPVLKK